MMEIVFLGTGSSVPSKSRNLASIWMRYSGEEGESFLFDCGEGTQRQMMSTKISFMKVDRIFISHWHADHWAGLIGLIQTMNLEGRKKTLYIYGPEAERFVDNILELGYWAPKFRVIPVDVPFEGDIVTVYKTKDFEIQSTPADHSVPAVIYRFKEKDKVNIDIKKAEKLYGLKQGRYVGMLKKKGKVVFKGNEISIKDVETLKEGISVVYTGDTRECKSLEEISQGVDLLIHDSTFESQGETIMHSGAKEAAELAKRAGVKNLVLTHFSRRYQDITPLEKMAKKAFPDVVMAKDYMKITLKKNLFKISSVY